MRTDLYSWTNPMNLFVLMNKTSPGQTSWTPIHWSLPCADTLSAVAGYNLNLSIRMSNPKFNSPKWELIYQTYICHIKINYISGRFSIFLICFEIFIFIWVSKLKINLFGRIVKIFTGCSTVMCQPMSIFTLLQIKLPPFHLYDPEVELKFNWKIKMNLIEDVVEAGL